MKNQSKHPFVISFMMVMVFGSVCALVTFAQSGANVIRRQGESDASYQARLRAANRRHMSDDALYPDKLIHIQDGESKVDYQARLRSTIRGLLVLQAPKTTRRESEEESNYQNRCRAIRKSYVSQFNHLVAHPEEDDVAYQDRISKWKQAQETTLIERKRSESEQSYYNRAMRAAGHL